MLREPSIIVIRVTSSAGKQRASVNQSLMHIRIKYSTIQCQNGTDGAAATRTTLAFFLVFARPTARSLTDLVARLRRIRVEASARLLVVQQRAARVQPVLLPVPTLWLVDERGVGLVMARGLGDHSVAVGHRRHPRFVRSPSVVGRVAVYGVIAFHGRRERRCGTVSVRRTTSSGPIKLRTHKLAHILNNR